MENTKIRDWYLKAYPEDEIGGKLNPDATFSDIFEALDTYQDVYAVMGFWADSMIRERVFKKLAEIMGVDYGYIYDQWLQGGK